MCDRRDSMADGTPLIAAAALGKLRLTRLLVEGGARVNQRDQRGDTALLAACRSLESGCPVAFRLIRYLLDNGAEPDGRDWAGRTALMHTCAGAAGPEVVAALLSARADPGLEDEAGVSALSYAAHGGQRDTLQLLLDACRQRGRPVLLIGPQEQHESPVPCTSPSDIQLGTASPGSEGNGTFDFQGGGGLAEGVGRALAQRFPSEPWLSIPHPPGHQQQPEVAPPTAGRRPSLHLPPGEITTPKLRPPPSPMPLLLSRRNTAPTLLGTPLVPPMGEAFGIRRRSLEPRPTTRGCLLPPLPILSVPQRGRRQQRHLV